jgi:hypothetical protein
LACLGEALRRASRRPRVPARSVAARSRALTCLVRARHAPSTSAAS